MAQDPSKYPTDNKIALSGSSQFTHDDSDPVGVIDDAKDAVSRQIGQDPNTLVMGQEVWESLKRNESLKGLIASTSNKIITLDLLKEFFEIENIVIGKTIYSNASNKFERVWGNNIILAYVPKLNARTEYDPAYGYTIRKKDALQIDEYEKEGNKVRYIRATDIYTPFLVGPEAGYLISNVNGTKGGK